MGELRSYKCNKCKCKLEFYEGIGMMFAPYRFNNSSNHPDSMWKDVIKSKDILRKVDDLLLNHNGRFVDEDQCVEDFNDSEGFYKEHVFPYGYKLYYSKERKMIYSLFDFKIEYIKNGEKKIYQPNYEKNINYDLVPLDDLDIDLELKCPKCGGDMNFCCELIFWD